MPHELELQIVSFLTNLIQSIGWVGIAVMMVVESANIPIPSEITMPLAGWLLIQDTGGTLFQAAWHGGVWGALGCTIGSVLSYALGYFGGRPLVERYGKYIMIATSDLERADKWFHRWGNQLANALTRWPTSQPFIQTCCVG